MYQTTWQWFDPQQIQKLLFDLKTRFYEVKR